MRDAVDVMIDRFLTLYGRPHTDDLEGFLEEYRIALDYYADAIILEATQKIIDTQTERWWPTPGRCKQVVADTAPVVAKRLGEGHPKLALVARTEASRRKMAPQKPQLVKPEDIA